MGAELLLSTLFIGSIPAVAAPVSQGGETVALPIVKIGTTGQSRCGSAVGAAGTNCLGFDGRDVRTLTDLFVVGYENNREVGEKHVLQTVVTVDLSPLRGIPEGSTVGMATLGYSDASTVHRKPRRQRRVRHPPHQQHAARRRRGHLERHPRRPCPHQAGRDGRGVRGDDRRRRYLGRDAPGA